MKKKVLKMLAVIGAICLVGCGKDSDNDRGRMDASEEKDADTIEYENQRASAFNNLRGDWSLTKIYDEESGEMTDWMRTQDKVASSGQEFVSDTFGAIGEGVSGLVDKTGAFHQEVKVTATADEIDLTPVGRSVFKVDEFDFSVDKLDESEGLGKEQYSFVSTDMQGNGFVVIYYPANNTVVFETVLSGEPDETSKMLFEKVTQ